LLKVENLVVRYGPVTAVKEASLEVNQGEMVCLLGANGAGKSSTMLAIAGARQPSSGRITFMGRDITALQAEHVLAAGIAMVPETREVFPDLTVRENLVLGGFVHRRDRKGASRDMDEMMEFFPILRQLADQPGGTLSGGEQQQLVIARAMMSRPKLLLLDEPSLGLAPTIVTHIFNLINQLRATGLTILLVEQNASKALRASDRAYVMSLGAVALSGTADEIASCANLKALYLGK